jgi:fumarate reductase subunit C
VTWFRVTPKAMPLWIGGKAVPPMVIVVAHWLGWAVASVLILLWAGG